jgi:hypothetical protein
MNADSQSEILTGKWKLANLGDDDTLALGIVPLS